MLSHENPIHNILRILAQQRWHGTRQHLSPLNFRSTVPYQATQFIDNLFIWRNQISSTANAIIHRWFASCISIRTRACSPARSRPRRSVEKCAAWVEVRLFAGIVVVSRWCSYIERCDETYKVTAIRPVDTRHLHMGLWRDSGGVQKYQWIQYCDFWGSDAYLVLARVLVCWCKWCKSETTNVGID